MTDRGRRVAALVLIVAALAAGCSSGNKDASSTTSTTAEGATVSLDAVRIVEKGAPDLPAGQAALLLDSWCAAARSADGTALVSDLQALPATSGAELDQVLGALQQGADVYCKADAAKAPDLLSTTYDALSASTTTTTTAAAVNGPSTTTAASRTASPRTATTVHHTTATTAAPGTTAATSSTTSTTDPCADIGNSTSGVMVGNGGASSCSHSTGG